MQFSQPLQGSKWAIIMLPVSIKWLCCYSFLYRTSLVYLRERRKTVTLLQSFIGKNMRFSYKFDVINISFISDELYFSSINPLPCTSVTHYVGGVLQLLKARYCLQVSINPFMHHFEN